MVPKHPDGESISCHSKNVKGYAFCWTDGFRWPMELVSVALQGEGGELRGCRKLPALDSLIFDAIPSTTLTDTTVRTV